MKTEFEIKLKTTRIADGYGVRIFINGLKTKYFASGGGYDKVSNVFEQFIEDTFINSHLFNNSRWGIESFEKFMDLIGGTFEIINGKKQLYYISFESSKLRAIDYTITKNSKNESIVWANGRVVKIFNSDKTASDYVLEIKKNLSVPKITLFKNNKQDGGFEVSIDEIVRGYIQSDYYKNYIVHRGMSLYIIYTYSAGYDNFSDHDLLIEYYFKNRDRLAEELGVK